MTDVEKKAANVARNSAKKVCVTGANGFIASHIVKQLLSKGYTVHGTVRDASNPTKTDHLKALPGAAERLKLFTAECRTPGSFKSALTGCEAVFHTATPVIIGTKPGAAVNGSGRSQGEEDIFKPGIEGVTNVMKDAKDAGSIKTFVLTSSMSAVAPKPEPALKSEIHWSDPDEQKSRDNWYGATKTLQEMAAVEYTDKLPENERWRLVRINPTFVAGPMLQPKINSTMDRLMKIVLGAMAQAPNDSMSVVDVRDCARVHVAAFEKSEASGRYMCLTESMHWNDWGKILKELVPEMAPIKPCEGEARRASQFDTTRLKSLGVEVRGFKDVLAAAVTELRAKGYLDKLGNAKVLEQKAPEKFTDPNPH